MRHRSGILFLPQTAPSKATSRELSKCEITVILKEMSIADHRRSMRLLHPHGMGNPPTRSHLNMHGDGETLTR